MAVIRNERKIRRNDRKSKRISGGRCPHCRLLFTNPLALSCGHSLCSKCCEDLMGKEKTETSKPSPLRTPMMGTRMVVEMNDQTPTVSSTSVNSRTPMRTPRRLPIRQKAPICPLCENNSISISPIRNHALTHLIRTLQKRRDIFVNTDEKSVSPTPSSSDSTSSGFESEPPSEIVCIRQCNIAVMGPKAVGKTQLLKTQYLNNLFFGRIDDGKMDEMTTELCAKYVLNIVDAPNVESLADIHGIVLSYSAVDRHSFEQLPDIINEIRSNLQISIPMTIVATKSDLSSQREVAAFDGQQLARSFGFPFVEVSAKENDGVNEVFAQLVQLIDDKPGE